MATLQPMTADELEVALATWRKQLARAHGQPVPARKGELRQLHDLLARAAALEAVMPAAVTAVATQIAESSDPDLIATLAPRPRVVLRLLRSGATAAAWQVLKQNVVGLVEQPGGPNRAKPPPLPTYVDGSEVFARLPGFRDDRLPGADDCYDVTRDVALTHQLDEVTHGDTAVTVGGWAVLSFVPTAADERVRLVLQSDGAEQRVAGTRVRRTDLAGVRGDALMRRAWAGWTTELRIGEGGLGVGRWRVELELDHHGLTRRAPLGPKATPPAEAATVGPHVVNGHALRWHIDESGWSVTVD